MKKSRHLHRCAFIAGVWLRARDLPADDADGAQGGGHLHGGPGAAASPKSRLCLWSLCRLLFACPVRACPGNAAKLYCPWADLPTSPHSPTHTCLPQAKEKLLEEMSASVAGDQEAALKRLLGEDEQVMKRREVLTHKLEMLKRAQAELTNVDV